MEPISEKFVDKTWQEVSSFSPFQANKKMQEMGKNQPELLAFFFFCLKPKLIFVIKLRPVSLFLTEASKASMFNIWSVPNEVNITRTDQGRFFPFQ